MGLVSLEKDLALSPASLAKILLLSKILITKLSILQFLAILKINNKNMNCPNCKNPNEKKLIECEWCGVILEAKLNNTSRNNSINVAQRKKHSNIQFILSYLY